MPVVDKQFNWAVMTKVAQALRAVTSISSNTITFINETIDVRPTTRSVVALYRFSAALYRYLNDLSSGGGFLPESFLIPSLNACSFLTV